MVLRLFEVLYWLGFIVVVFCCGLLVLHGFFGDLSEQPLSERPIALNTVLAGCGYAVLTTVHYICRGQFVLVPWQLK